MADKSTSRKYNCNRHIERKYILSFVIIFFVSGFGLAFGSSTPTSDSGFYTLHPLIVHFPIVLLIIACLTQLFGFFVFKYALSWVTLSLLIIGFGSAFLSGSLFHPHVKDLQEGAKAILIQHEFYADLTVWISCVSLILKGINHFIFKRKLWLEIIIVLTIGLSAISVGIAGHYGAWLTHIEGVGPQGNYLEIEEESHDHSH